MANLNLSRHSGRVLRGGSMRRETLWLDVQEVSSALPSANSATFLNSLGGGALALRPFTIVRSRFSWMLRSDQRAASEVFQSAFGICVVSDQASAIGVTAIPTPFTDLGSDLWLLHEIMAQQISVTTDVGVLLAGVGSSIDSKAMRKVEDGQDIAVVVENSSVSAGTVSLTAGRILVKLH